MTSYFWKYLERPMIVMTIIVAFLLLNQYYQYSIKYIDVMPTEVFLAINRMVTLITNNFYIVTSLVIVNHIRKVRDFVVIRSGWKNYIKLYRKNKFLVFLSFIHLIHFMPLVFFSQAIYNYGYLIKFSVVSLLSLVLNEFLFYSMLIDDSNGYNRSKIVFIFVQTFIIRSLFILF